MKRLGLARPAGDPLALAVLAAGWQPVAYFSTEMQATLAPPPGWP